MACARRYNLPLGDFPNVDQYRKMLREVRGEKEERRKGKAKSREMRRIVGIRRQTIRNE